MKQQVEVAGAGGAGSRALSRGAVLAWATALLAGAGLLGAYLLPMALAGHGACPLAEEEIGRFVRVDGGGFIKGAQGEYPEEGRPTRLFVSPFLIQVNEVTNAQFGAFVAETGYVSDAENGRGSARFAPSGSPGEPGSWWRLDRGATWRTPDGAGSNLDGRGRHPVVHVSLNDARAYAKWAGGRLPSEVEWVHAASLGLFDPQDQESGVRGPDGAPLANVWDGTFPTVNTAEDGFRGTAPVGCYPPSLIGVHDMIGNVWEWTEGRFGKAAARFSIKGGSFLCGKTYCRRYRPAARASLEPDSSTAHVGFRVVKDLPSGVAMRGAPGGSR